MRRFRSTLFLVLAVGSLARPARAAVYSVTPIFSGQIGLDPSPLTSVGQPPVHDKQVVTDASGTHYAQLDATLQTGPGGTFAFENSHVGTGTSYGNAMTELSISVTNDSRTRQDLRLDSEVTPGHIAARDAGGSSPDALGSFVFQVFRLGVVLPFYHVDATIIRMASALVRTSMGPMRPTTFSN